MICNKCKKKVAVNKSVCPYCNNSLVKKIHSSNNGSKNKFIKDDSSNLVGGTVTKGKGTMVKIRKNNNAKTNVISNNKVSSGKMSSSSNGSKNKYLNEDNSNLVGGVTTNRSFIKLEKNKKSKNIPAVERKDYNNYIDYKEAKADIVDRKKELVELKNKKYTEKDVSTKIFSIEKVRRSSKVGKELLRQRDDFANLTGSRVTDKFDTGLDKKKQKKQVVQVPVQNTIDYNKTFSPNITYDVQNAEVSAMTEHYNKNKKSFKTESNLLTYAVIVAVWIIAVVLLVNNVNIDYYFSQENGFFGSDNTDGEYLEYDGVSKSGQTGGSSSDGVTSVIYDNQYLAQFNVANEKSVFDLIVADSIKQKTNCPDNILAIENEIINNYGITAVNLCEMDEEFARELRDVVQYIYINFPKARNYLTNLTLANVDSNTSYMAAFMPMFTFATSNSNSGYPIAVKTQILLNAKYFLNYTKLENSVDYGVRSGYFPANANRSSTVAHEFGHYLSYIALLNYYKSDALNFVELDETTILYKVYDDFNVGDFSLKILEEAYNKFVQRTGSTMSFYQFRESISQYAVAKNSSGAYIYDETIAEAFHDYYLNKENAAPASLVIVEVLRSKL